MDERAPIDVGGEAAKLRPALFRLALLQLRDPAAADDAVQEAILAAIEGASQFEGRSSVKTWLFSILRYKVLDALRAQSRLKRAAVDRRDADDELDVSSFDALFDENGCWAEPKDAWADPHAAAETQAFLKVLEACLTRLPARTSRAFLMREWLDIEPRDICVELDLSPGNLRVLLWRARMQLRHCLDLNWDRSP